MSESDSAERTLLGRSLQIRGAALLPTLLKVWQLASSDGVLADRARQWRERVTKDDDVQFLMCTQKKLTRSQLISLAHKKYRGAMSSKTLYVETATLYLIRSGTRHCRV